MHNNIEVPLFIRVMPGALTKFDEILKESNLFMNNALIVTDFGDSSKYAKIVKKELKVKDDMFTYIEHNTYEEVKKVERFARSRKADFIIGVGGGKALDIAKLASFRYGSHFISVPTLSSHDGISSPVASIIIDGKRMSLGASMPSGIIIDVDVIRKSPPKFIYSGIMDLVSNISAIKDWELAYEKGFEIKLNGFSKAIAYSAAESVINYKGSDIYSTEFMNILLNGLVLSGIAMEIAGSSRPASGAEHNFSHAFDMLYPHNRLLHGEKVGIGHLIISYFRDKDEYSSLKDCLTKLGIIDYIKTVIPDNEEIVNAMMTAQKIRRDRYSILNEIKLTRKAVISAVKEIF